MPSIPSSPRSPKKRRKSSVDLHITSTSPHSNVHDSRRPSFNRRSSQYSTESSITRRLSTSQEWPGTDITSNLGEGNLSGGLGNLADELAEAFDSDEELGQAENLEPQGSQHSDLKSYSNEDYREVLDNTVPCSRSQAVSDIQFSPPNPGKRLTHRRLNTQFDASYPGNESENESPDDHSSSLESRLVSIESLALPDLEVCGDATDNLVHRFAGSLKELSSQTRVESGITRLITSHSSLSSHLANQSRLVLNLSHPLTSPLHVPPDPSTIDELVVLLADLVATLPTPSLQCLPSLHSLHTLTRDLQSALTQLTDTIYMTRQTSTQATRKLKTASDMVFEMRKEANAREEGVRWIEEGRWDSRLKERECARTCQEVVGGFEAFCNGWRERIARDDIQVGAA